MSNSKISGELFKKMFTNGAIHLKNNHKEVDFLNVFPVPDGDTGTNMQMTMMAGVKEVSNLESKSIVDISKILSRGLLMGARGNSGVILSQFFRGVYTEISKTENGSISVKEFIQALVSGSEMAYRAVMEPVEGTILTVVRESAERVKQDETKFSNIEEVLVAYLAQANETLIKTPDLLPVLKEAGVVDSGGAGFIKIIEGMLMAIQGQDIIELNAMPELMKQDKEVSNIGAHNLEDTEIKYGYCTEFIVQLFDYKNFDINSVREPLNQMGDSLVAVTDEDLLKIHVHTNQPGVAMTLGQKFGDLLTVKVDNMRIQHSNIMNDVSHDHKHDKPIKERSKYAVISICSGDGIKEAFTELGVDYIIDGGQTMNPSTEVIVNAIKESNADSVIILPNNSNIILTAEQAMDLSEGSNVRVLKTKTIAQGYASLMAFDPTLEIDDNYEQMMESVSNMKSGEVTYAIRDTEINGVKVKKDDFIGITDGKIVVSTDNRLETTKQLVNNMVDEDKEIVTIFFGVDVSEEELEQLIDYIEESFEDVEIESIEGKQDIYSYIIAVE